MTAPTVPAGRRLPLVLRNRAFGTVWLGQVLTQAAVRMFQVGVSWWLISDAASGAGGSAAGLFMAVSTLPAVVLAPLVARAIARFAHRSLLRTAAGARGRPPPRSPSGPARATCPSPRPTPPPSPWRPARPSSTRA